jgi:hypothetical protein
MATQRLLDVLFWQKFYEDVNTFGLDINSKEDKENASELNTLRDFLINTYKKVDPDINFMNARKEETPPAMLPPKIYKGLKYNLLDVDEYTLIKKFFAAFFKNDKLGM